MLRKIVEARALVALAMSGGVGLWGLRAYPVSHDDVFLGLIGERAPGVLSLLTYGYGRQTDQLMPSKTRRLLSASRWLQKTGDACDGDSNERIELCGEQVGRDGQCRSEKWATNWRGGEGVG